jgi:hypothetical protein
MPKMTVNYASDIMRLLSSKEKEVFSKNEILNAISIKAGATESVKKRYFQFLHSMKYIEPLDKTFDKWKLNLENVAWSY